MLFSQNLTILRATPPIQSQEVNGWGEPRVVPRENLPHEEQRKGIPLQLCFYPTTHIIIKSSVSFGPRIYGMASFKINLSKY